jgi:hypothetical protein
VVKIIVHQVVLLEEVLEEQLHQEAALAVVLVVIPEALVAKLLKHGIGMMPMPQVMEHLLL